MKLFRYNNLEHIGYDHSGKKLQRRYHKSGVDAVIASKDDPNYKWTVVDERQVRWQYSITALQRGRVWLGVPLFTSYFTLACCALC